METDRSASAPPADWSKEKPNMGQAVPPPYQDNTSTWSQQPPQGYAPQPPQGYPPQPPQGYPPQPQGYGAPPFHNQGPGYGQQAYQGQTVIVVPTPLENPVNDYLCYSIFTVFCCCMPLGIAALIYSIFTRGANRHGDRLEAERTSRMAKILNHAALGVGVGIIVIIIVCQVVIVSTAGN